MKLNPTIVVVTGGAGFIGSHLVDDLLSRRFEVRVIDNFRTGKIEFLKNAIENPNFSLFQDDLLTSRSLEQIFYGAEVVYHLAANADVRNGPLKPSFDLEQNTIVTQKVLEYARVNHVQKFVFASTGSVYGRAKTFPTTEDAPFPIQTSLYGASKMAGEALVTAYCEAYGIQSWIFRFVSILGPRYTHGHVVDFFKQLVENPRSLLVLGDGHQRKSYLHVSDCINALTLALTQTSESINIFNLGVEETCEVRDSIRWILEELNLEPEITFGSEKQGWVGDNPLIHLSIEKITSMGWGPRFSIEESVKETIRYLAKNLWLLRAV